MHNKVVPISSFEPFDINSMQRMATENPVRLLSLCKEQRLSLDEGCRRAKWGIWVACYASALRISQSEALFDDLLKHAFFRKRTYEAKLDDVLRLSFLLVFNAGTSGARYKNACYVAAQLQPQFKDKKKPEDVLAAIVDAGGLGKFRSTAADPPRARKPTTATSARTQQAVTKIGKAHSTPAKPGWQPQPSPNRNQDNTTLVVRMTEGELLEILVSEADSEFCLGIKVSPSHGGWRPVEAISLKPLTT